MLGSRAATQHARGDEHDRADDDAPAVRKHRAQRARVAVGEPAIMRSTRLREPARLGVAEHVAARDRA